MVSRSIRKVKLTKHRNSGSKREAIRDDTRVCVLGNGCTLVSFTELRKTIRGRDLGTGIEAGKGEFGLDIYSCRNLWNIHIEASNLSVLPLLFLLIFVLICFPHIEIN